MDYFSFIILYYIFFTLATSNVIGSPPGTAGLTGSAACSLSKGFLLVAELCLFKRAEVTCDTNGPISAKEDKSFQKEIQKRLVTTCKFSQLASINFLL